MWAIIPVRWTNTPASEVWSAPEFGAWMDKNIRYSLAHFLDKVTLGQLDVSHHVFKPVVMDDPRRSVPAEPANTWMERARAKLMETARAAVTAAENPGWSKFSHTLYWYAQQTDTVGGGGSCIVGKYDGFSMVCHEMLHADGFEHSIDGFKDYGSPYDIMAAVTYGDKDPAFWRPHDPALPTAVWDGTDMATGCGPLLAAAQLWLSKYRDTLQQQQDKLFRDVTGDLATPVPVRLHALDHVAETTWPDVPGPVLIRLPSRLPIGDDLLLEFRRGGHGYDQGLRTRSSASIPLHPPAGVVVHKIKHDPWPWKGLRVEYMGVLPLVERGDQDFRAWDTNRPFVATLRGVGPHREWVDLDLRKPDAIPPTRVDLSLQPTEGPPKVERRTVLTKPCFGAPRGEHTFTLTQVSQSVEIEASAFGFETPGYVWRVNGEVVGGDLSVPPGGSRTSHDKSMSLAVRVQRPLANGEWERVPATVQIGYRLDVNVLRLTVAPGYQHFGRRVENGNFNLTVEVTASEVDPGVVKNSILGASITTGVEFRPFRVTWDGQYKAAQRRCAEMLAEVLRKRIPIPELGPPRPEWDYDLLWSWTRAAFRNLARTRPIQAHQVLVELAELTRLDHTELTQQLAGPYASAWTPRTLEPFAD